MCSGYRMCELRLGLRALRPRHALHRRPVRMAAVGACAVPSCDSCAAPACTSCAPACSSCAAPTPDACSCESGGCDSCGGGGVVCANTCASPCGPLTWLFSVLNGGYCGDGCGEIWWGDFHGAPPTCCEPCNRMGEWTGQPGGPGGMVPMSSGGCSSCGGGSSIDYSFQHQPRVLARRDGESQPHSAGRQADLDQATLIHRNSNHSDLTRDPGRDTARGRFVWETGKAATSTERVTQNVRRPCGQRLSAARSSLQYGRFA